MRIRDLMGTWIVGILISGCVGMQSGANSETRAALAPLGKLRVGFSLASIYATRDPAMGELKGVPVDLGKDLARRIGVPFDPIAYPNAAALIAGAKAGEWDVAVMGISPGRAAAVDFSAPFMEVELGYLVRAGVAVEAASDVDVAGMRIGVREKTAVDAYLSSTLKNAVLLRAGSSAELYTLLDGGKADAIASSKSTLFARVASRPEWRVLDGRFTGEPIGMSVPKGRGTAAAMYVGKFVEDAKADGLVRSAIERAALRGVVVAPLK